MSPSPPSPEHAELLVAWQAWDERPGDRGTAQYFTNRCVAYAGLRSNDLRRHLAAARRDGLPYDVALREWDIIDEAL